MLLIHTAYTYFYCASGNITNIKKIEMNYVNYETAIVQGHGVKLIGFPLERFVNPSELTNITDM
jgi:hypothetical protein